MQKIYTDDPRVKYVTTSTSPEVTRAQIDAKLREYNTFDILWHWRPELNDVYVQFIVEEEIDGVHVKVPVRVIMPVLWNKANRNARIPERRTEGVNLECSMRTLFWYIKSCLENSYAMQSSRAAAFLSDMAVSGGKRFFDVFKLELPKFAPLEYKQETTQRDVRVISPPRNVTHEQ